MGPEHGRCLSLDTHHNDDPSSGDRLRPRPATAVGWTFTLLAAGACKGHNPHVPRGAASRLFRETPSKLADRVLQPADCVLQLAFRLIGDAFGPLLVRLCGPNSLMARRREASHRPPCQRDPDRSRPSDGTAGC
jgi:hypothetical protein